MNRRYERKDISPWPLSGKSKTSYRKWKAFSFFWWTLAWGLNAPLRNNRSSVSVTKTKVILTKTPTSYIPLRCWEEKILLSWPKYFSLQSYEFLSQKHNERSPEVLIFQHIFSTDVLRCFLIIVLKLLKWLKLENCNARYLLMVHSQKGVSCRKINGLLSEREVQD